jgi:hypothetical protein
MRCLLEKPGCSVIRHRICFHRTRQIILQLPQIVWSSANRCHQGNWDTWPASKRYPHFGGGSVHCAQKYWHPVRVHKGSTLPCTTNENRTVVFQFKNGETIALAKTPMEKISNGMKFGGRQLLLRLILAWTVHKPQGITLQRAVIDCRMKFWEHGQLYVALSGVNCPSDLCILLSDDMDDLTIGPAVDVDVVQIRETVQSSRPLPIPQNSPGHNVESGITSIWCNFIRRIPLPPGLLRRPRGSNSLCSQSWSWRYWNIWSVPGWYTSQCSDHVMNPWAPTDASI